MPDDGQHSISEAEFAEAYDYAMRHVKSQTRRRALADLLHDAATDGLMWARKNYDPARGKFGAFAANAVRVAVKRAVMGHVQQQAIRPSISELTEFQAAPARKSQCERLTIDDLPERLAFAVRLYMVDGYDLRECGMLLGVAPNTVRQMLRKAAELLAPDHAAPVRKAGERRLGRTDFERDRE